jgi:hypothetical protein
MLTTVLIHSATAQSNLTFEEFNRQSEQVVSLPFALDNYWLFEKGGNWGLYSETQEKVLVPANYDLVLPSLQANFFYVISGQFVGIYNSYNKEELLKPEFTYLQFLQDDIGRLYIKDRETVLNERSGIGSYIMENSDYYLLSQSIPNGTWSISEGFLGADLNISEDNLHKDNVMYHMGGDWIHNYTHLEIKNREDKQGHLLTDVMEASGIISSVDKTYKIPAKYYAIQAGDAFITVDKVADMEIDYFPSISTQKGMYTLDYHLIGNPKKGHNGGLIGGGGFYFYGSKVLKLFNSAGAIIAEISNFDKRIGEIHLLNDKYYVGYDVSWKDTDTPGQLIYSRNGELIGNLHFSFEHIYEEVHTASVSVIDSLNTDESLSGILDLTNDQMLIETKYDWVQKMAYKHTLFSCPDGACSYFYGASLDGKPSYFDSDGNFLNQNVTREVDGRDYQLTSIDKRRAGGELENDPFLATHEVMFGDGEMYFDAREVDTYKNLAIYETRSEDAQQIKYGISYKNGGYFILAPNFELIAFDKNLDQVKLTYKDKTYVFPISRYAKY